MAAAGQKSDASRLVPGEHMYEVTYYTVDRVDNSDVHVTDSKGTKMRISRSLAESSIYTTTQFAKEVKLTRTEMARLIESLGQSAFKVVFNKQVTSNDVADGLENEDLGNKAKRRKVLKKLWEGTERTMNARLFRTDEFDVAMELGRYRVIDLDALKETGDEARAQRLVDTRTVSELVVNNTRYHVD